jgi:MFS family permease
MSESSRTKQIVLFLLSTTFFMLAYTYSRTYSSLVLKAHGFSLEEIAISSFFCFFSTVIACFYVARYIPIYGHKKIIFYGNLIASIMILLQGFYINIYFWCFINIFIGLSVGFIIISFESWFLLVSKVESRGLLFGIFVFFYYLGQIASQLMLGQFSVFTLHGFLFCSSMFLIAASVMIFGLSVPATFDICVRGLLRKLITQGFLGMLVLFINGLALGNVCSFLPIYALNTAIPVSLFMSTFYFGGLCFQIPVGYLSDRNPHQVLICICSALIAVFSFLMYVVPIHSKLQLLILFVLGGGLLSMYPLAVMKISDRIGERYAFQGIGMLPMISIFGSSLGPVFSTSFIDYFALSGMFLFIASSFSLLSLISIVYILRRNRSEALKNL